MNQPKFRILIFLESLNIGGAERQAINLAAGLIKNSHSVKIISLSGTGNGESQIKALNIPYICLNLVLYSTHPAILRENKKRIRKEIRSFKATHLLPFTYWPNVQVNSARKKRFTSIKSYWNQRDMGIHIGKYPKETDLIMGATSVIGNSEACISHLETILNIKIISKSVIFNGISVVDAGERVSLDENRMNAVMIANISKNKDHETLIRAWRLLKDELSDKTPVLNLAGDCRDTYDDLDKLIKELDLENDVVFLGMVQNIKSLLEQADFAVFSSNNEGSPNGLLECMSVGLPIVASDIPSIREAVGNDYKFLVPIESPEIFYAKVLSLSQSKGLMQDTGQECLAEVNRRFTRQQMVSNYLKLFAL